MIVRREIVDYFREYENVEIKAIERELKVPLKSDFIISIIGPRRAGKTYYLLLLRNYLKNSLYLNFEDTRLLNATYKDLREIIRIFIELYGRKPEYLLLDEIQNVNGWENIVRELYDLQKYKIFITGSSSKLLSKEIATKLRGRTLSFTLLPFSFREFLKFKEIDIHGLTMDDEAKIRNYLMEYLQFGGFPDVVKNVEKLHILREYSDLILFRDFIERHNIKNISLARGIHQYVLQNFAKEISIMKIYNKLKSANVRASKDSVYNYISKLEDTLFFFFLRKYTKKVHLRESWPKKIYLCDTGLSRVVRYSEDYGRLIENAVFLEFIRKRNTDPLLDVYYFKFPDGEVDFLIKKGEKISEIIQVTYASSKDEVDERETKNLIKAGEEFGCKKLTLITWNYEGVERKNNTRINCIPLWKWLLKEIL